MATPAASSSSSSARIEHGETAPRAVIFDLDGLLLDTERLYRVAFERVAIRFGVSVRPEQYAAMIGVSTPDRAAFMRDLFGAATDRFVADYYAEKRAVMAKASPIKAGAAALLDKLDRRGAALAIATSASALSANRALRASGLRERFRAVATRDDVAVGKPAPDVFLFAARALGVPPARCVVLEDSPPGLAAATAAGMIAVMVPDLVPPTSRCRATARAIVPDLHAASRFLDGLFAAA